jgi:large subunit ribosomal protein L24
MAAKLRKGDKVVLLAGKDKGKEGEITSVSPTANKAVVDGVNLAIRHTKQSATSQGGRIAKAMPIDLSNLSLIGHCRLHAASKSRLSGPHPRRDDRAIRV